MSRRIPPDVPAPVQSVEPRLLEWLRIIRNAIAGNTQQLNEISDGGGGFADAASDSKTYGRRNAAWNEVLPITGGTLTGPLTQKTQMYIDGAAGSFRILNFSSTPLTNRWQILANSTAEGGSNSGSDFQIFRCNDAGASIDAPLSINRASGAVSVRGTQTNDAAAASFIGELISSNITSPITLTNNTQTNIGSISLTPGDWDVTGEVWFSIGTGGASAAQCSVSSVSATLPAASALNTSRMALIAAFTASNLCILPLRPSRISLSVTTTYYLVGYLNFPSGTSTATGNISARRAR